MPNHPGYVETTEPLKEGMFIEVGETLLEVDKAGFVQLPGLTEGDFSDIEAADLIRSGCKVYKKIDPIEELLDALGEWLPYHSDTILSRDEIERRITRTRNAYNAAREPQ